MQSRVLEIYAAYSEYIQRLVPLQVEDGLLKIILYFADSSNLRVTEEWENHTLVGYSYYWLTAENRLKIGWDNAPHHTSLANFPHHKHVAEQSDHRPSDETCLEEVMQVILAQLPPPGSPKR